MIKMQLVVATLGHRQYAPSERGVPGAPDGERCTYDAFWRYFGDCVVPDLDRPIERAGDDFGRTCPIPVKAVNLCGMSIDGDQWYRTFPIVPDAEESIMRRSEYVRILSVPLDLCGSSIPIAEAHSRSSRCAEIPAMYKAVNGACCEDVWMESRKIDICNGSRMSVQHMFNWSLRA